jgi:hypothetical protein
MKRSPIKSTPWSKPRVHKPSPKVIDPGLRQQVRAREGGLCALCRDLLAPVWECHHRKLRSRGGQDSVTNLVALCSTCHRRVHGHPAWSEEHGFMVPATQDPASVPVAVGLRSWQHLHPSGAYRPCTPDRDECTDQTPCASCPREAS